MPAVATRRDALCYDLECLEYLFDSQALQQLTKPKALQRVAHSGDAADDQDSTSSTDMPPSGAPSKTASVPAPEFAFDYPSNSAKALQIRQDKSGEIDNILEDITKCATRVVPSEHKADNGLNLRRPADLLPPIERYKKQGLTQYDKKKEKRFQLDAAPTDGAWGLRRPRSTIPGMFKAPQDPPMCYCREVEGNGEIIKCDSELCQIGTFHLACCQIDEATGRNERFYCYYCAPNLGVIEREVVVHGVPPEEEHEESDHNNSAVINVADDSADEEDEDSSPEPAPLTGSTLVEDESPPRFISMLQVDGSDSPQEEKGLPPVMSMPLPEDSSNTTFSDLAPFIEPDLRSDSAHKLTPEEGRLVNKWKESCSPSELVATVMGRDQAAKPTNVVTSPVNKRLSQVLSEV